MKRLTRQIERCPCSAERGLDSCINIALLLSFLLRTRAVLSLGSTSTLPLVPIPLTLHRILRLTLITRNMASSSGASYRPRGWYWAQDLTPPAGTSMGDEDPCELPDGRLVCGAHGLVRCSICCRDYNFMDDLSDSEDEDSEVNIQNKLIPVLDPADLFGNPMRRGTGRLFPTQFPVLRDLVPLDVFRPFVTYNKATR